MFSKKPLFGAAISPSCAYCARSRRAEGDEQLFYCEKKGIVPLASRCRFFKYDPLRRIPKRQPQIPSFSEKDFQL